MKKWGLYKLQLVATNAFFSKLVYALKHHYCGDRIIPS